MTAVGLWKIGWGDRVVCVREFEDIDDRRCLGTMSDEISFEQNQVFYMTMLTCPDVRPSRPQSSNNAAKVLLFRQATSARHQFNRPSRGEL